MAARQMCRWWEAARGSLAYEHEVPSVSVGQLGAGQASAFAGDSAACLVSDLLTRNSDQWSERGCSSRVCRRGKASRECAFDRLSKKSILAEGNWDRGRGWGARFRFLPSTAQQCHDTLKGRITILWRCRVLCRECYVGSRWALGDRTIQDRTGQHRRWPSRDEVVGIRLHRAQLRCWQ